MFNQSGLTSTYNFYRTSKAGYELYINKKLMSNPISFSGLGICTLSISDLSLHSPICVEKRRHRLGFRRVNRRSEISGLGKLVEVDVRSG